MMMMMQDSVSDVKVQEALPLITVIFGFSMPNSTVDFSFKKKTQIKTCCN